MDDTLENTATETIDALEIRLRRLEYLLVGNGSNIIPTSTDPSSDPSSEASFFTPITPSEALLSLANAQDLSRENSIHFRLSRLDKQLNHLYNRVTFVKHILDLQSSFPELFPQPQSSTSSLSHYYHNNNNNEQHATTLSIQEQLSTILPLSSKFHSVASQLLSIVDSPIPNPHSSAALISLLPTVNKIALLQEAQKREIAELRERSLALLEKWYLIGVEGVNEGFAQWDERTLECDRVVGRKLRLKEQEEKEYLNEGVVTRE